ncbi:YokU family protein [Peribacillus sp. SCS-155]|uniref:YokU family protein n=1 Tax=Peribacillus sedimenti TaxID=3115297 RepID=UPI0039067B9A
MPKCEWCSAEEAIETRSTVYWELPDGSRAIGIADSPTIQCRACGAEYQEESIVKRIEDQLFLIDVSKLNKMVTFAELMAAKRLLKRNYFDFS